MVIELGAYATHWVVIQSEMTSALWSFRRFAELRNGECELKKLPNEREFLALFLKIVV